MHLYLWTVTIIYMHILVSCRCISVSYFLRNCCALCPVHVHASQVGGGSLGEKEKWRQLKCCTSSVLHPSYKEGSFLSHFVILIIMEAVIVTCLRGSGLAQGNISTIKLYLSFSKIELKDTQYIISGIQIQGVCIHTHLLLLSIFIHDVRACLPANKIEGYMGHKLPVYIDNCGHIDRCHPNRFLL